MKLAPIVLFVYNRPEHVKRTVESLQKNEFACESDLIICSDGPKTDADEFKVNAVRQYIRTVGGFKSVKIKESPVNKGLANSVISGVTEIVNQHGKIIVIEDDVLTSKYFIKFMNDALNTYEDNTDVLAIGSWNYFASPQKIKSNFFFGLPDSIAWATYQRSWTLFETDGQLLLDQLRERNLINKFNMGNSYEYDKMLQNQIEGKVSSWAIRWTATAVLNGKLTYYPQYSMTKHIGFGNEATHCICADDFNQKLTLANHALKIINTQAIESKLAIKLWQQFHCSWRNYYRRKTLFSYYFIYLPRLLASKIVPKTLKIIIKKLLNKYFY